MKVRMLLAAMLLCAGAAQAQDDPTIMTINGQPVSRSEFEYSYNKNNAEGVIDKKSVDEYVDLFVNYKLKVQAALDAQLDTLSSFKKEFRSYRDQQIRPSFVTDADVEREALDYYDRMVEQIGPRGLFTASHILLRVDQKADQAAQDAAKVRIDSVYTALQNGADFAELAKKVSQDPGSARNGGKLPKLGPNQTVKEFEDMAYSLQDGQMSKPFQSPFGWHIIKMDERSQVPPYDSLKVNITRFLESRGVRERIVNKKIEEMIANDSTLTQAKVLDQRAEEMQAADSDLKNLVREYHDGLLLFEISNRTVWDKAAKDEAGLAAYFKKHKKDYKWETPRYKGIAYHVKEQADVKAVRDCVKGLKFDDWADKLRKTFNNDSIIRIRVEKGVFKEGDNGLIDREVFGKKDAKVKEYKDYPIDAVFGQKLKAPKDYTDVKGLVTADYQDALEKEWVADLRKKYPVVVNKEVLATVNNH